MKTLILTEKPSVAMDFAKALGVQGKKQDGFIENESYIITWAVGHLVELLNPDEYDPRWKSWRLETLPIIPEKFYYKPIPNTEKQLRVISGLLKRPLDRLVIATDAGREGEVIARTILLFTGFNDTEKLKRFWTSQALTPQVVKQGMKSFLPASQYDRLWRAGQARQIADWIVGMSCTRAATIAARQSVKNQNTGQNDLFSVGRVQTAVLSLLVDRRRERENFKPEPYWLLRAFFINEKGEWWGNWFKKEQFKKEQAGKGQSGKDQARFDKEEQAIEVLNKIKAQTGTVKSVKKQKKKQAPPFLYSLTELQQEANRRFAFSAKNTLSIAQDLYEQKKCLSYPRTDSVVLGSQNVDMAQNLVNKLTGAYPEIFAGIKHELITLKNKRVFNDARLTDHHALIPLAPIPQNAGNDERKIYNLVLKRFAAAFYPDFEFEQTDILTEVEKELFQTKGKRTLNLGWKSVYQDETQKKDKPKKDDEEPENLPPLNNGDPARVKDTRLEKKMTQPPPEYTEALLLKDMTNPGRYVSEDELKKIYRGDIGLGTQATRAQIIETLLAREYLIREKKQVKATDKGCRLIESLRRFNSAKILTSPEETARWEMQLDQIAQGKGSDGEFLNGIKQLVCNIIQEFKTKTGGTQKALGKCPACKGDIIEGKKGYGCANWRDEDGGCRFVVWKTIAQKNISIQMAKELLEKGSIGPFDDFISKKGSPFSTSLKLMEIEGKWEVKFDFDDGPAQEAREVLGKCPACGGDVTETKKAYGCSNWKEEDGGCKFVVWKNIAQKNISIQMLKDLLEKGSIGPFDDFISKKGSPFSAGLKLMEIEGKWEAKIDFDDGPEQETREALGKCPACGGDITEGKKAYGCSNWKEEDGACKFVIWKITAQKEISKKAALALLENGITDQLFGFISKKGNAFSARLKLEGEQPDVPKVVFDFPD